MLIIIENDPQVPPGIYGEIMASRGIPHRLVRCHAGEPLPDPVACRAVVVLGGAMGVHDTADYPFLADVKEFIRAVVARQIPFLGICLGGQLLAESLEGSVTSCCWGEQGTLPVTLTQAGVVDPLFAGIPDQFTTFQWHNDCFTPPAGALLLARSSACPHQAFRLGTNAYGLQFHPEVNEAIVALWSRETPATAAQSARYVADFTAAAADYDRAATHILDNFLSLAGLLC
ncbi:MAG TPA: type 1 glutamine amidotransferase [Geobacteraceae bacterium]